MRILKIVLGAVAVAAAALAGLWFYNSGQAREQIDAALVELRSMGVDARYDELSITGFPTAYRGEFVDLVAQVDDQNIRIAFPEAAAGMSLGSIGTVGFELPDSFTITYLDDSGSPLGPPLEVTSEGLVGDVTPGSGSDYAFLVRADTLRIAPQDAPDNIDSVTFADARWSGALEVDMAAGGLDLEAAFTTASVDATFLSDTENNEGVRPPIAFRAEGVRVAVDGEPLSLSASVTADAFDVDGGSFFQVDIDDYALSLDARPDQPLQLAELLDLDSPNQMAAQFIQVAAFGILEGGSFDQDFSFGALRMSGEITDLPAGSQVGRFTLEGDEIGYSVDVARELMGVAFEGARLSFSADGDLPQTFSFADFELAARARSAADGFELTPLATPDPLRSLGERLAFLIRDEISQGGSVEVVIGAAGYDNGFTIEPEAMPRITVAPRGDRSTTRVTIDREEARVESRGDAAVYAVSSGILSGEIGVESLTFDVRGPIVADDAVQTSVMVVDLNTVTIDDALWSQFLDPEGVLDRSIRGLRLDTDLNVVVTQSILDASMDGPIQGDVYEPRSLAINEALIELLGMRMIGAGVIDLQGSPSGRVDVTVSGWRDTFAAVAETPLGGSPQVAPFLEQATVFLEDFGVPGERPQDTRLAIRLESTGDVTVNGRALPF